MSASTKLSTSVKALCLLAREPQMPHTSGEIARRIGVNASKLRMLLSMLAKNGMVRSVQGVRGGFVLNRPAEAIHLQEIYCAIEDRKAFHLDVHRSAGPELNESARLNNYFLDLFADIQVEIEDKMRGISLRQVIDHTF